MVTLKILCEGATERNFVVRTLIPHLKSHKVFVQPVNLGGTPPLKTLKREINNAIAPRRSHVYVTTMLDLYGLGSYPGNKQTPGETSKSRVDRIQASLSQTFSDAHFIPYIQLHEFEALVLADVEKF